jgi:hypothetical protein
MVDGESLRAGSADVYHLPKVTSGRRKLAEISAASQVETKHNYQERRPSYPAMQRVCFTRWCHGTQMVIGMKLHDTALAEVDGRVHWGSHKVRVPGKSSEYIIGWRATISGVLVELGVSRRLPNRIHAT